MSFVYYLVVVLALMAAYFYLLWRKAQGKLTRERFAKQSLASKYGKMTEQFMPLLEHYPYDSQRFRFIGTPIDGVQFEDNEIILVEFKTSTARLSGQQKNIQELVKQQHVRFEEVRM